ncbi:MAG: nucleoside triphosphate pyrophosphohydrolase [Alistipes sp.]|nr:nucleoside triphosphate pyrophosphohydrolase [Alistipes sp.]
MDKKLDAIQQLLEVMDRLRVECPWDRKQTFDSLRMNTIEETYELADALLDHDMQKIKEELGDLLLHVVFYAKMGSEQAAFDIGDVADTVRKKLIFRHPHVFGNVEASTPEQVKQNWEDLKLKEKALSHEKKRVLSGVPHSLPAMVKAYRVGEKAASAGFDWEEREAVWKKVQEEIGEVQTEMDRKDPERMASEFGDLFFSLINAARLYKVDPEAALEQTNRRFIERFTHMEERAEAQGVALREMTLAQMDQWWSEAKQNEKTAR